MFKLCQQLKNYDNNKFNLDRFKLFEHVCSTKIKIPENALVLFKHCKLHEKRNTYKFYCV
jgi:hypothetical protein